MVAAISRASGKRDRIFGLVAPASTWLPGVGAAFDRRGPMTAVAGWQKSGVTLNRSRGFAALQYKCPGRKIGIARRVSAINA
jgi:hypothetical protein